uniref:Uncharacterized protein n=1 Tax=Rhizophora mucronata TaxID=61149 RepID=A0A2P2IK61_RHIMU
MLIFWAVKFLEIYRKRNECETQKDKVGVPLFCLHGFCIRKGNGTVGVDVGAVSEGLYINLYRFLGILASISDVLCSTLGLDKLVYLDEQMLIKSQCEFSKNIRV